MEPQSLLTPRQEHLLFAVCRDYVVSGQPASSGGLVKAHGLPWSSATVRNELAALERLGLVERSHHSSGRSPTQAGMQRYVSSLSGASALRPELVDVVDRSLQAAGSSVGDEMRATSRVLSEVAGCVAISFVGAARGGRIEAVDVAPLVLPRALVVLGFDDGSTVMRPVTLEGLDDEPHAADRGVRSLQERLRALCTGRTLDQAVCDLQGQQQEHQARIDRVLSEALRVGLIVCAGASLDPLWLQVAGQRTLAGEGAVQPDALGDLLGLLEDYRQLADVLCQLLPSDLHDPSGRAQVRVGVPLPGRAGGPAHQVRLTLVGCRLALPQVSASTGLVALLGSDRMDYACAIPLVEYAARSLASQGDS